MDLQSWAESGSPEARAALDAMIADPEHRDHFKAVSLKLAYAHGKPPDTVNVNQSGSYTVKIVFEDTWQVGDARTDALARN